MQRHYDDAKVCGNVQFVALWSYHHLQARHGQLNRAYHALGVDRVRDQHLALVKQ
jgi:hypothetical protein